MNHSRINQQYSGEAIFSWFSLGMWGYFPSTSTFQFKSCYAESFFFMYALPLRFPLELCPPAFPIQHSQYEFACLGSCQGTGSGSSSQCNVEVLCFLINFGQFISIRLPRSCYTSLIRIKDCVGYAVIKKFLFLLVLLGSECLNTV